MLENKNKITIWLCIGVAFIVLIFVIYSSLKQESNVTIGSYSYFADLDSAERNLITNRLSSEGIGLGMAGSIGYSIFVTESDAPRAREILKELIKKYNLKTIGLNPNK